MQDEKRKQELISRFNQVAAERETWIKKNRYYYEDQARYYRFLVSEGLSVLELGCGIGDLLHALKPGRGVGVDFSGGFHQSSLCPLFLWGFVEGVERLLNPLARFLAFRFFIVLEKR